MVEIIILTIISVGILIIPTADKTPRKNFFNVWGNLKSPELLLLLFCLQVLNQILIHLLPASTIICICAVSLVISITILNNRTLVDRVQYYTIVMLIITLLIVWYYLYVFMPQYVHLFTETQSGFGFQYIPLNKNNSKLFVELLNSTNVQQCLGKPIGLDPIQLLYRYLVLLYIVQLWLPAGIQVFVPVFTGF